MYSVQQQQQYQDDRLGRLSPREIIAALTERNDTGEYLRTCVVDVPRVPSAQCRSLLHIGNPYDEYPAPVTLPSRIGPEEAERILASVIPIEEFSLMFEHLASAYQARSIAIIEGETSIGKTLAVNVFTKLLYGERVVPLDFYCVGQSDNGELMGKWVPNVRQTGITERLKQLREDPAGAALVEKLELFGKETKEFAASVSLLNELLKLPAGTQWEFQDGAAPKAAMGTFDESGRFFIPDGPPRGCILHVQEIGLAKPAVVDTFLKMRGERAKLARSFQLWEDGGRIVPVGDECFIVMTTNPPENYIERNEIDFALVRASEFLRIGELGGASLRRLATAIFTHALPGTEVDCPPAWGVDLRGATELGREIASFVALWHEKAAEAMKGGEPGRVQRTVPTVDDFDRLRSRILREQVMVDGDDGELEVDVVETLARAVRKTYLARLSSPKLRQDLESTLDQILKGDIGKVEVDGVPTKRCDIIKALADDYIRALRQGRAGNGFDLRLERIGAEVLALREQASERWGRLARAGVLPALSED